MTSPNTIIADLSAELEEVKRQLAAKDAEIAALSGYCKTVDDLRTIATDACNKAWVEIEGLKQQLAEREKQIVGLSDTLEYVTAYITEREDWNAAALLQDIAKNLVSITDLSNCILCDADPVGRLIGEEEPLYKARKP